MIHNQSEKKGKRKIEERDNIQTHIFYPLCLHLSDKFVTDRLGTKYDKCVIDL